MPNIIEVNGLTKRYGTFAALNECCLSVPEGSIFGLLGPNGAGKTTLIRCLMGYLRPKLFRLTTIDSDRLDRSSQHLRQCSPQSSQFNGCNMNPMNMNPRRHFLTSLGASTLALSLRHVSLGQDKSEAMQIALLSDTHLHAEPSHEYRRFRPYDNLVQASKEVLASEAKFALLCGDAARLEGKKEDYVQLKKLLEPITSKMKMEIALGNHDDRANFWTVFNDRPIDKTLSGKKHVSVADLGPQRWIVLDSLMYVDKTPGFLGQAQRDWLDKFLGSDLTRPVVLMVHHTLGQRDGDLLDTERLLAIANKHSNVKAIVFGHSHQWRIEQRERLWLINLPALGYNFADDQPIGWVKAELRTNELLLTLSAIGGNKTEHGKTQTLKWLA